MEIEFNWQYPKKLEPVFESKKRYILLKGGRSSGKSHFIARKLLEDRLYKKRDLLCVREYQRNLEQSNYKLFRNLINQYRLPYKIYADKFVCTLTGAEIVFEGMNNLTEDNVKSYEGFHDAWIEEGQNFSKSSFQKLDPTIRQEGSQIYVTMNPNHEEDPVYNEIVNVHPNDNLIIHINYLDNPFCSQDIVRIAENYKINNTEEYEHIYLGLPKKEATGLIVKGFTSDNIKKINYMPELPIYVGMDFNRDPMCWVMAHKDDTGLFFFDEFVRESTWIRPCIQEFLDIYENHKGGFVIMGDASGKQERSEAEFSNYVEIINEFDRRGYKQVDWEEVKGRQFGMNLLAANPDRTSRFNSFNARVVDIFGNRNIFIDPEKCKWLLYNIKHLKHKAGSNEFDIPTSTQIKNDPSFSRELKFLGHPYDAASYIVYKFFPLNLRD
jgi:hypothetical protein